MPMFYEVSPEREKIDVFFTPERAARSVVGYFNWGYDYIQRNYGPENLVVLEPPYNARFDMEMIRRSGRDFYIACHRSDPSSLVESVLTDYCTPDYLKKTVGCYMGLDAEVTDVLHKTKVWHLFQVDWKKGTPKPPNSDECGIYFGNLRLDAKADKRAHD
jgi:hypothetical protein